MSTITSFTAKSASAPARPEQDDRPEGRLPSQAAIPPGTLPLAAALGGQEQRAIAGFDIAALRAQGPATPARKGQL
jgi:hypothetical protein